MKKEICVLFAAALTLSAFGCDKKKSESSKTSSLSGEYTVCDEDGFTNGQATLIFEKNGKFSTVYGNDSLIMTYHGNYEYSDGIISLDYDKIKNVDELKKVSELFSDGSYTDEELETVLEFQNANLETLLTELFISDKNGRRVTYVGDEHEYRKEVYSEIATNLLYHAGEIQNYAEPDAYGFFCSDTSLNENIPDDTAEELNEILESFGEYVDSLPYINGYTPEEGLTEHFDIDAHEWLIVVRGNGVYAAGIGDSFDSELFGRSDALWYFDGNSFTVTDANTADSIKTLNDLYNYYKNLEQ